MIVAGAIDVAGIDPPLAYWPRWFAARLVTWWRRGPRIGSDNALAIGVVRNELLGRPPPSPRLERLTTARRERLVVHMLHDLGPGDVET